MSFSLATLREAVANGAAIRRVQRLEPAGGAGDKVFPPTYPGEGRNEPPRYIFETRRINGEDVRCVLLDSVQSQANRLEETLLHAVRQGRLTLPYIVVDFSGQRGSNGVDVGDLGEITSLEAPHRVFDAIIRDSLLDGVPFTDTDLYKQLILARPNNALAVFKLSPTSLVFGVWNSTGQGGGLGARFARCVVSEIVGVGAREGLKAAVRIDPLGISRDVRVVGGPLDWRLATGAKGEKPLRPSEINHSNILSGLGPGGVTIDYALHTAVISCAGLRRLRFPDPHIKDEMAGRTVLAALALVALTQQDLAGYSLRSRCDLTRTGQAPFAIVWADGSTREFDLDADEALAICNQAIDEAKEAGFPWDETPIRLTPQPRLVELVAISRAKALRGESEDEQGGY